MSTIEHKNSIRTIEAQIVQKLKNNEARPNSFTGSYKKKRVNCILFAYKKIKQKSSSSCSSIAGFGFAAHFMKRTKNS